MAERNIVEQQAVATLNAATEVAEKKSSTWLLTKAKNFKWLCGSADWRGTNKKVRTKKNAESYIFKLEP